MAVRRIVKEILLYNDDYSDGIDISHSQIRHVSEIFTNFTSEIDF